jgi:hypothetical protein
MKAAIPPQGRWARWKPRIVRGYGVKICKTFSPALTCCRDRVDAGFTPELQAGFGSCPYISIIETERDVPTSNRRQVSRASL